MTTTVRGLTISTDVALVTESCCNCGVLFAMTSEFVQRLRARPGGDAMGGLSFYCPNGHQQHYTAKTEAQKQRERAERLEQQLASRDEDLRAERVSHAATKGQLTRTRRRAVNGVCPCCQRTFQQLARHMKAKHPEHVQ